MPTPLLTGDEVLSDGSTIHWDDRDPDNSHKTRVTCGECRESRYVHAYTFRQRSKGLCRRCASLKAVPKKENSPHWKGGRQRAGGNYIRLRLDVLSPAVQEIVKDMVDHHGTIYEHRIVAAVELGRALLTNEVVHHRNGVKDDNCPENLEVCTRGRHVANHIELWNEMRRLRKILEENGIPY